MMTTRKTEMFEDEGNNEIKYCTNYNKLPHRLRGGLRLVFILWI